MKIS
jgi:hypothetical protein